MALLRPPGGRVLLEHREQQLAPPTTTHSGPRLPGPCSRTAALRKASAQSFHSLLSAPRPEARHRRVPGTTAAHSQYSSPAPAPAPIAEGWGAAPARGTELGLPTSFEARFEISSLLGVGSFGTVHLATDRTSGREVAVKKLRKDLPRGLHFSRGTGRINRQKLLKRLRREIDTLRALDGCPSAIAFEGAFEDDAYVYLVMDVCHGGDLETLLKACGALGERHAAMLVWEVLRLVGACHASGILHGDIKPSNFLLAPGNPICPVPLPPAAAPRAAHRAARRDIAAELAEAEAAGLKTFEVVAPPANPAVSAADAPAAADGAPPFCPLPNADCTASDLCVPYAGGWLKGVDFGCSHEARPGVPLTKMTGTPAFMAPEVYDRNFGVQADMWSLGMLTYQALSDRLPFWRTEDDMRATSMTDVRAAVAAEPIPLDYGPWLSLSPECHDFVTRCLQHDPEQRMTAVEAAAHPWFVSQGITEEAAAHGGGYLSSSGATVSADCSMAAVVAETQQRMAATSNIVPLTREDAATHAVLRQSPSSDDLASQAVS